MTDDSTPTTTRRLLERIADTLDVSPAYFRQTAQAAGETTVPNLRPCDEAAALFRAIKSPARREAVLQLLRAMARED